MLSIRPLTMLELSDARNQKLYVNATNTSVFFSRGCVFARTERYPAINFLVTGWKAVGSTSYSPVTKALFDTEPALKEFHRFYAEKFSLYECGFNHIRFKRNLDFDLDRLTWIHKRPGRYVAFQGSAIRAFDITPRGAMVEISPFEENLPISHPCPDQAWY